MVSGVLAYTLSTSIVACAAIVGLSQLFAEIRRQRQPGLVLPVWRVPTAEELQAYALALGILAVLAMIGYGLGTSLGWVAGQIVLGPLGYLAIGGALGLGIAKLWAFVGRRSVGA
jgi:hypothetical protein